MGKPDLGAARLAALREIDDQATRLMLLADSLDLDIPFYLLGLVRDSVEQESDKICGAMAHDQIGKPELKVVAS